MCLRGLLNSAISAPKLADTLVHLFRVGLAWYIVRVYHSVISSFLELNCHHKSSNHLIISKLMHHFYLQHLPSYKWFDPCDVKHLLSLLRD